MNSNARPEPKSAFIVLLLLATGGMLVAFFIESRGARRQVEQLQIETILRDERIEQLENQVRELEFNEFSVIAEPHGTADLEHEIARLSREMSDVLARIESSAPVAGQESSDLESLQQKQAGLDVVRAQAASLRQEVSSARSHLAQVAKSTSIPDELAVMPIQEALDTPSLKEFRPYFEARADLNRKERIANMLALRERTVEMDLNLAESGGGAQNVRQLLVNQQFQVDNASQRVTYQKSLTRVPDELAGLPAKTALSLPSLAPWWPYFEAKEARDLESRIHELLQMRVETESLEEKVGNAAN